MRATTRTERPATRSGPRHAPYCRKASVESHSVMRLLLHKNHELRQNPLWLQNVTVRPTSVASPLWMGTVVNGLGGTEIPESSGRPAVISMIRTCKGSRSPITKDSSTPVAGGLMYVATHPDFGPRRAVGSFSNECPSIEAERTTAFGRKIVSHRPPLDGEIRSRTKRPSSRSRLSSSSARGGGRT